MFPKKTPDTLQTDHLTEGPLSQSPSSQNLKDKMITTLYSALNDVFLLEKETE